jgi:uncharacterized membrane protein YvlD (DUF360 family)
MFYFNRAGLDAGAVKFVKVIAYVAASGALVAIADYLKGMSLDQQNYILIAIVGLVNALIAGALKILSIKK